MIDFIRYVLDYWRKPKTFNGEIIHTYKQPLKIQHSFIFSKYHQQIVGDTYKNRVMRESYHCLIDEIAKCGCIEYQENDIDQLNKEVRLTVYVYG